MNVQEIMPLIAPKLVADTLRFRQYKSKVTSIRFIQQIDIEQYTSFKIIPVGTVALQQKFMSPTFTQEI